MHQNIQLFVGTISVHIGYIQLINAGRSLKKKDLTNKIQEL